MKSIYADTVVQRVIFQKEKWWIVLRTARLTDEELKEKTLGYIKTRCADQILRAYLKANKDKIHWIALENNEFDKDGVDIEKLFQGRNCTHTLAHHALIKEYTNPSDAVDVLDDVKAFINDSQHKLAEKLNEKPFDLLCKCPECTFGIIMEHDHKCDSCHREFCSECGNLKHLGECDDVQRKSFQVILEKTLPCPGCSMRIILPEGESVYCYNCKSTIDISSWKVKTLGLNSPFVGQIINSLI